MSTAVLFKAPLYGKNINPTQSRTKDGDRGRVVPWSRASKKSSFPPQVPSRGMSSFSQIHCWIWVLKRLHFFSYKIIWIHVNENETRKPSYLSKNIASAVHKPFPLLRVRVLIHFVFDFRESPIAWSRELAVMSRDERFPEDATYPC